MFLGVHKLVGGFKHFLFSIIYGIILPIDFHIFQDGYCTTNQKNYGKSPFSSWVNQLFLWVYIKPCWDWPFRDLSRSIIRLAPSHGWIIATKGKNIGDFKPLSSEKWSQTDVFRMLRHVETLIITINPIISPRNAHFMLFIPLYSSSIPFKSY